MSVKRIQPLQSNNPIVLQNGVPTPEFMRLWQDSFANILGLQQSIADVSASIPAPVTQGYFIPLVDGAEPPAFITDGAGQLILVPWSP